MKINQYIYYFIITCSLILVHSTNLFSQHAQDYRIGQNTFHPAPPSNGVFHATSKNDSLWFGTSRGLTLTTDEGTNWQHFSKDEAFQPHGIFAIHVGEKSIWASTGYVTETAVGAQQAGSGLTYSRDGGNTWHYIPQPIDDYSVDTLQYGDNKIPALGITIDIQNIIYNITTINDEVWIASWAGGVRRSKDFGETWERVILPPDNLNSIAPDDSLTFSLSPVAGQLIQEGHLNHMGFSVYAASDSSIWVGTANGINVSFDGGVSWKKMNHQNQIQGILGNWTTKIAEQKLPDGTIRMWATSWPTDTEEQYGINFTDDHGETWINLLHGVQAYDFAFKDSIVYVATSQGIMRTDDAGKSWNVSGSIIDRHTGQRFVSHETFAVAASSTTNSVWIGTSEGIARTIDYPGESFGYDWQIFRVFTPVAGTSKTYAYPNPFSPAFTVTRVHYDTDGNDSIVTIELFDFAMNKVRTLIRNAPRSGNFEHDEIWDGKDDAGRTVPNGVYFYRISLDSGVNRWGKIMVLR